MNKKQGKIKIIARRKYSRNYFKSDNARARMVRHFSSADSTRKKHAKKMRRRAKLIQWFLPTDENSLKPRALSRGGLALLAAILLIFNFAYLLARDSGILGKTTTISRENLLEATNIARKKSGLQKLSENSKLNLAAKEKAHDMLAKNYWSHVAPDGKTPWKFLAEQNYSYVSAGENLARGFSQSDSIIQAWLDSPSHRENVLAADFSEVGFAVERGIMDGKITTVVVALYGAPLTNFASSLDSGEVLGVTKIGEMFNNNDFQQKILRALKEKNPLLILTLTILALASIWLILLHFLHHRAAKILARPVHHMKFVAKLGVFAILAFSALLGYSSGMLI